MLRMLRGDATFTSVYDKVMGTAKKAKKRHGPKETFMQKWLAVEENVEHGPVLPSEHDKPVTGDRLINGAAVRALQAHQPRPLGQSDGGGR
eukprot:SAG11_NODE_4444_length_1892_cov_1.848299_1_plen_91_part_00